MHNSLSSTDEQITIQIGHYSNFVGTHFWNYQDELLAIHGQNFLENDKNNEELCNFSELYRFGQNQEGVKTCFPRAIIIEHRYCLYSVKMKT
jgi:hypothetical protein